MTSEWTLLSDAMRGELLRVLRDMANYAPDSMPVDLSGRNVQLGGARSAVSGGRMDPQLPHEWRVLAPSAQGRTFFGAACSQWSLPTGQVVIQVGHFHANTNRVRADRTFRLKHSLCDDDDDDEDWNHPPPKWLPQMEDELTASSVSSQQDSQWEHQLDEWMERAAQDFKPSLQPYIWIQSNAGATSFLWVAYPRRQVWVQGTLPPTSNASATVQDDDTPVLGRAKWNALWLTPQDTLLREASKWTRLTLQQLETWSASDCDTHHTQLVAEALLEPFQGSIDELRRQAKLAYLANRLWNQPLPSAIARLFPLDQLLHNLHPTTRLQRMGLLDEAELKAQAQAQAQDDDPRRWQETLIRYPVFLGYIRARGWTLPRDIDRLSRLCPWFVRLMASTSVRYVTGSASPSAPEGKQAQSPLEITRLTISPCNDGPVTQCPDTLQTIHAFLCLTYVPHGSSAPVSFWIPNPDMLRLTGRHDEEAKLIETWCRLLLQQPDQRPRLLGVFEAQQTATYDLKSHQLVIRLQQDRADGSLATWMPKSETPDAASSLLPRLANPVQDWLLPDKWFMYLFRDRTDAEQLRQVVHLLFVMMTKTGEGDPRALEDAQRWYTDMEDRMDKQRLTWDRLARKFLHKYPGMSDWWSDLMRARRFVAQLPEDDKDPWDPKLLDAWVQRVRAYLDASPFQFLLPPSSSSSLSSSSLESIWTIESPDLVQLPALSTRLPPCKPSPPFTFQCSARQLFTDIEALSESLSTTHLESSPSPHSSPLLARSASSSSSSSSSLSAAPLFQTGTASRKRKAPSSSPPDSPALPKGRARSERPSAPKRPRLDTEVIVIPDSDSDEESVSPKR
jgi:hypothetical protein